MYCFENHFGPDTHTNQLGLHTVLKIENFEQVRVENNEQLFLGVTTIALFLITNSSSITCSVRNISKNKKVINTSTDVKCDQFTEHFYIHFRSNGMNDHLYIQLYSPRSV